MLTTAEVSLSIGKTDIMRLFMRNASTHIGKRISCIHPLYTVRFAALWTQEHCLLSGNRLSVSRAPNSHYNLHRHFSTLDTDNADHEYRIDDLGNPSDSCGVQESGKASGQGSAIEDFVDTCKEIEEHIVFDRKKYSKQVKDHLSSFGSTKIGDVFRAPDCLNSSNATSTSTDDFLSAVSSISQVYYVSTVAGIGLYNEHLMGYIEALHSALLDLLDAKHKVEPGTTLQVLSNTFDYSEYGYSNVMRDISKALALLLLSAAEAGAGSKASKYCNALLDDKTCENFLESSTGSCINAVAFIAAMTSEEGAVKEPLMEILAIALDILSTKERTLSPHDLFYCKLWLTCINAKHPTFMESLSRGARSFVDNVVMLDHITETIGAIDESHAALATHIRKSNLQVELDSVTLEPFVFSVLSFNNKELYIADVPDNYFDGATKSQMREWLHWRRMIAELNGWKVVTVEL